MSQDPDQDDHLIFGAETESEVSDSERSHRSRRDADPVARNDGDAGDPRAADGDVDEDDSAVYGAPDETTRVRPQAPYTEPSVYETQPGPYDRRPPSFEDSYADDQPRFVDPPPAFQEPAARDEPPRFDEPASYEQPRYAQQDEPRWEDPRYEEPRYEQPRYDQSGYGHPQQDAPRYEQASYEQGDERQDSARYDAPRYEQQPGYGQAQWGEESGYEDDRRPAYADYESEIRPDAQYGDADDSEPLFAETQNLAALRRGEPERREAPRPAAQEHRPPQREQRPAYPDAAGYPDPTGRPDRRGAQHAAPPPAAATPPPRDEPPPRPRPEDLLAPNRYAQDTTPASWGWRGRVSRGSGGLFKPKASQAEMESRQAVTAIQRSFSRPMTVVVVQPKGGAGKTPTTICLSAAFGAHRGGYVVGWDDNETRGTLAVRVANPDNQRATVWDLLSDLDQFERLDARVGDLSYYVRAQPEAHFDALVSDDNPGNMAQIGEEEYRRLHQVLQRFYRLIVVDTGNNVRSPNWQSAVNSADMVVVVSTYQRDVGWSASWVLDHLAQTGREELARNAVTVLTSADPTFDKDVRDQLISHFTARTRAVAEIPYDPELAHGGPITWTALNETTRNAWVHAGAIVVNALVEKDNKTLDARRA